MTLSIIQAIRAGRKIVPDYITGALVKLQTRKNLSVTYHDGSWYRAPTEEDFGQYGEETPLDWLDGEWVPLPMDYVPDVGGACLLGAVAVAMGCDLSEMADSEHATFYAHPDFFVNEDDREQYPDGFVFQTGRNTDAELRKAKYPCVCATTPHPQRGGMILWDDSGTTIPEIIAHLNDQHDPRRFEDAAVMYSGREVREIEKSDLWPEERIVEWLRSMGYNGDHKP